MPKSPPKRKLLGPRDQWDNLHPGPIAQQIHPTHVDKDLIRYEFIETSERYIKAWVKYPSPSQNEIGCDFCPKKHSKNNNKCSANAIKKRKLKPFELYNIATGERLKADGGRFPSLFPLATPECLSSNA